MSEAGCIHCPHCGTLAGVGWKTQQEAEVAVVVPKFDRGVRFILGQLTYNTARIGRRLHALGLYDVPRKIEEEQAATLHWMLTLYAKFGDNWLEEAEKILKAEKPKEGA